jgi:hypothetical protein
MRSSAQYVDPWESADPGLALALEELRWYRRAAGRARIANQVSEVLLLLLTAATTVAAALAVTAWVTAVLAAGSLILTGLRRTFDWHEKWVSFMTRWSELRSVVHQYRLLPDDRRDEETRRRLVSSVDDIVSAETEGWASRRRRLHERTQQSAP